jgi:hypothetical protein
VRAGGGALNTIPISPVERAAHVHGYESPYRLFIAASLVLGIGGGFALAILLPLAQALEWDWGIRYQALVQVHGQLQLLGFAGLFTMGMSLRIMPRFSSRPLAYPPLVRALVPLIVTALVLRSLALPAGDGFLRDGALIASAALQLAGGVAFAAVVCRTLLHRDSKAESTAWFFVLGSLGYLAASIMSGQQTLETVRDGLPFEPLARHPSMLFVQQYGFVLMFLSGVATRAVPVFTGHARRDGPARAVALLLACGVALSAGAWQWVSYRPPGETSARVLDAGLLLIAAAFLGVAALTGVFRPSANRVAAASQLQFQFVRSAMAWLAGGSLLLVWYAARAFAAGGPPDTFELDAARHVFTVGVTACMIVGMAMLIVPEFAARRMQHRDERALIASMLVALNAAVALRAWPAIAGIDWLGHTRGWPMAASGGLATTVIVIFAAMFAQSYLEQRKPAP